MSTDKIPVFSNSRHTICISLPNLRFKKEWNKKGSKVLIDREILEDAIFDPGVEYMFKSGILYIESMEDKIALGLEPQGATEPENIIVLSDKEIEEYMSSAKQGWQFREVLKKLSREGKRGLCDYVVEHELLSSDKIKIIQEECGFDVLTAVKNKQANEAKDAE